MLMMVRKRYTPLSEENLDSFRHEANVENHSNTAMQNGGAPDYLLFDPEYESKNIAFLQVRLKGENVCVNEILSSLVQ